MTTAPVSTSVPPVSRRVAGLLAIVVAAVVLVIYAQIKPSLAIFWLFGLGFGLVVQRSRFCFAAAFRDLSLLRDGRLAKGVLVGLAIASLGFTLNMYNLSPDLSKIVGNVYATGWHTLLGGLLFGAGMVVAGGCASGTMYRMGEGYVAQWVAPAGMLIGSFVLALHWQQLWPAVVSQQPKLWFPQALGWGGALALTLGVVGGLCLLVLWWESRAGSVFQWREEVPPDRSFGQRLGQLYQSVFVRAWPAALGGMLLGLLNIMEFTYKKPWGITTEVSRWSGWIAYSLGYPAQTLLYFGDKPAGKELLSHLPRLSGGALLDWGLIFGAFTAAQLAGEFKVRFPPHAGRYAQSLLGRGGHGLRRAAGDGLQHRWLLLGHPLAGAQRLGIRPGPDRRADHQAVTIICSRAAGWQPNLSRLPIPYSRLPAIYKGEQQWN